MVKLVKYVTVIVGVMLVAGMLPITAFAQAAPGLLVGLALGAALLGTLLINRHRRRSAE